MLIKRVSSPRTSATPDSANLTPVLVTVSLFANQTTSFSLRAFLTSSNFRGPGMGSITDLSQERPTSMHSIPKRPRRSDVGIVPTMSPPPPMPISMAFLEFVRICLSDLLTCKTALRFHVFEIREYASNTLLQGAQLSIDAVYGEYRRWERNSVSRDSGPGTEIILDRAPPRV